MYRTLLRRGPRPAQQLLPELLQSKSGGPQRAGVLLPDTGKNIIDIPCKPVILGRFGQQGVQLRLDSGPDLSADHQVHIQKHPKIGCKNGEMIQINLPAVLFQGLGRQVGVRAAPLAAVAAPPPGNQNHMAYTRGCRPEELSTDYSKVIPLGRDGKLDEVGNLVAFLVSDRASYIAGTTLNISGGKSRG